MNIRSACASFVIAAVAMTGGAVSASAATPEAQPRVQATSCAPGGQVVVSQDFGPNFKWTLQSIRYSDGQNCNVLITNSGYSGKMVLRVKWFIDDQVFKDSARCTGCAELPYGTGGFKKVKIKAVAFTRAGERYVTPWRTVTG